jgi:TM2 domain-containing membrane protein YozV
MYYIRWRDTQSGPYESHQILQLADQGLISQFHEVIDSVTYHSMTVQNFQLQMQQGIQQRQVVLDAEHLQQLQIQQLQSQQDEIKRLKEENERISRRPLYVRARAKSRAIYILLALFLGIFGVHNFYAGRTGVGVAQLCITSFLGVLILPLLAVMIVNLIEIVVIDRDSRGVPMQ